jgi:hypothetical protein
MTPFTFQLVTPAPASAANGKTEFFYETGGPEPNAIRLGTGAGAGSGIGGAVTVAPVAPTIVTPGGASPSITLSTQSGGAGGYQVITREGRSDNVNKEDLGTQTIEGVPASGTRITITIPAGQIGNEAPIAIVDERWFSKDLQAFVMTRHNDPRSGETVYRLTNINRSEPNHSLFVVPADYEVSEKTLFPTRTRRPENN